MAEIRALLLTDVVDSTKLTERIGDAAMAEVWSAHDRAARDLLPAWRGRDIHLEAAAPCATPRCRPAFCRDPVAQLIADREWVSEVASLRDRPCATRTDPAPKLPARLARNRPRATSMSFRPQKTDTAAADPRQLD